jgi:LysM repeat protein
MHLNSSQAVSLLFAPLVLCQCSSLTQPIAVEGELSSPETSLPRYEYPFDESGRYREDWVGTPRKGSGSAGSGSRIRSTLSPVRHSSASSTRTNSAPTPSPTPISNPPALTPAPSPLLASASTGARRQEYHTVTRGDTLWSISRQYGISVSDLKTQNGISADSIRAGEVIRLP